MKTEFTPEEEALIEQVRDEYISSQTVTQPDDQIEKVVKEVWQIVFSTEPEVIICDSPIQCRDTAEKDGHSDLATYWSFWYVGHVAMYDFAKRINLEIDEEKFEILSKWSEACPFVMFDENIVYVSRRPVEIHFNDEGQLHNEEGMSCAFADGWGIYTLNGVSVDEQIVMRPETQTLKQIRDEENEEVRRIRIERYGWDNYLTETGASLVDERQNDIEGTNEFLFETDDMKALLCACPSTGKEFVLEVPPETKTCKDAQSWLSGGLSDRIISAS